MELHQLRYFVAAAEELSITAAAKRLFISQPALSRQISALEEELGVLLFDRIRKRIHLTDAGRFFLQGARQILCDLETLQQKTQEDFAHAPRTIRLGLLTPFMDDVVTPAMRALRKTSQKIDVGLFELSPRAQLDRLRAGDLDLALVGNLSDEDRQHFATRRLMRNRMAAVLPDDHPLAGRKQILLKELRDSPWVSLSDALFPGRRQFLRSICQGQGFEPDIMEEADSISLLLGCVSSGSGVALLPMHSRKLPHAGCVFIHLKTPIVHVEVLAVFRGEAVDEPMGLVLQHLQRAAAEVAED